MARILTYDIPNPLTRMIPDPVDGLTSVVLKRDIRSTWDGAILTTKITVVIGEFDAAGKLVKTYGPFKEPWPGAWDAKLDALDGEILAWAAGNKVPTGAVS